MKCPECRQALPVSLLRESVGVCHHCDYRIWIKKTPGLWNRPSWICSFLVLVVLIALNFVPWSFDSSTSAWDDNGIQYGFPFESSHQKRTKTVNYDSGEQPTYNEVRSLPEFNDSGASANVSFAVGATLMTWFFVMLLYKQIWYRHHFTLVEARVNDPYEEDESYSENDSDEFEAQPKEKFAKAEKFAKEDFVMAQLADGSLETLPPPLPARDDVKVPSTSELKTMALGAKLIYIAGWLFVVYMGFSLAYSIVAKMLEFKFLPVAIVLLFLGVAVDLVGRILCTIGSANNNERAACVSYLFCGFLGFAVLIIWIATSAADYSSEPSPIGLSFMDFCLGLVLLILSGLGIWASIAYCGAISDNAMQAGLRYTVTKTKNAFLTLLVMWLLSFPLGYVIGYAIGKRSSSISDFQYAIGGVEAAFQFVIGAIAINAMLRHLLMYRYAEKYLTRLAKLGAKLEGS